MSPVVLRNNNIAEIVSNEDEQDASQRGQLIKKYRSLTIETSRGSLTPTGSFKGVQSALKLYNQIQISSEGVDIINNFLNDISNAVVKEVIDISANTNPNQKVLVGATEIKQAILNVMQGSQLGGQIAPRHMELAKYNATVDDMSKTLEELIRTNEGWTELPTNPSDKMNIYKKAMSTTLIQCVKGIGVINAPPSIIKNIIRNLTNAVSWYPLFESAKLLEFIDRNTEVWHWKFSARVCLLKQQRDFCLLRHRFDKPDGSFMLVARSIEHKLCPEEPDYTRGEILTSGFHIRQNEDNPNSSIVTYVANVDPKGLLPEYLKAKFLNVIADRQPRLLLSLRKYVEEVLPKEETKTKEEPKM